MKKAILIEQSDMKKILADYFNVSEKDVIKSQYSYTVTAWMPSPEPYEVGKREL